MNDQPEPQNQEYVKLQEFSKFNPKGGEKCGVVSGMGVYVNQVAEERVKAVFGRRFP